MNAKKLLHITTLLLLILVTGCRKDDFIEVFGMCPEVVSTFPENAALAVPFGINITATFNEAMNPATIDVNSFTLIGTTAVSGTVSTSGVMATFNPNSPLTPNTTYVARMKTSVKDVLGNTIQEDYVWSFTTGSTKVPLVIETTPVHNATGVVLNQKLTATFDMSMDVASINASSFTLKQGLTSILGTISYSGSTATFIPNVILLPNTSYTATLTTEVKNTTAIPLASNYIWSFTTNINAATPIVNLKSTEDYGILTGVGISNNAGFSEIHDMNVGISPGVRSSITGFPPAIIVNGYMYASDDSTPLGIANLLIIAKQDLTDAYLFAEGATFPAPVTVSGDQGGLTLTPGIYKSTSTLLIQNGNLTLDAQGDANACWIFQIASDFTTVGGAGGNIILAGGAQAKNIFWQVGSSATIGDYTIFKGNILALTSITMNSYAVAEGRMLSQNGSVVMTHTNFISRP